MHHDRLACRGDFSETAREAVNIWLTPNVLLQIQLEDKFFLKQLNPMCSILTVIGKMPWFHPTLDAQCLWAWHWLAWMLVFCTLIVGSVEWLSPFLIDSNLKLYTFTLTLEAQYHCGFCQSGKTNRNVFFSACLVKLLDRFPELHLSIKMC